MVDEQTALIIAWKFCSLKLFERLRHNFSTINLIGMPFKTENCRCEPSVYLQLVLKENNLPKIVNFFWGGGLGGILYVQWCVNSPSDFEDVHTCSQDFEKGPIQQPHQKVLGILLSWHITPGNIDYLTRFWNENSVSLKISTKKYYRLWVGTNSLKILHHTGFYKVMYVQDSTLLWDVHLFHIWFPQLGVINNLEKKSYRKHKQKN